jgi:tRNA-specific 2-thiouridylase
MIVCALSGGVDSATAAALLVEAGHRVVGVTMRLYNAAGTAASVGGRCCGPRDIEDARRVCDHLGIPFYVVDFEEPFSREVIGDFARAYLAGETPNPCVRCNQHVKFTPLLARARALGAEVLATGHYARLEREGDRVHLRRAADAGKDQSYFLFSMPLDELAAIRFPLGALTKDQVRGEARRLGLPNAEKPDSQEICFVPDGDYPATVERVAREQGLAIPVAGEIVDESGAVLGRHRGIHRYTVGQRRGLGDVAVGGEPVYVIAIEPETRRVVVGPRRRAARPRFAVVGARWFVEPPAEPFETAVQVRHRAAPVPARVIPRGARCEVELAGGDPPIAAPGQAAVFYREDTVLGGGWIER